MSNISNSWSFWAFMSAIFAALTAILAKVGIAGVNSNYATFIRTVVILGFLIVFLYFTDQYQPLSSLSRKSLIFLVLSGLATGLSWLCYFHALKIGPVSQVAPIDKLSLLIVAILGVLVFGEKLSLWNWAGVAMMAVGAILLVIKK